jgi:hypothetical protein
MAKKGLAELRESHKQGVIIEGRVGGQNNSNVCEQALHAVANLSNLVYRTLMSKHDLRIGDEVGKGTFNY